MSATEVEKTVDSALMNLTSIDKIYCGSDHYGKRKLIGSIYPEKFNLEQLKVRTAKLGEVFRFIYMINNELGGNKNRTNDLSSHLSQEVIPLGFEPRTPTLKVLCSTC